MSPGPTERSGRGAAADPRFEQAPIALLVADADGEVVAANARWRHLAMMEGGLARGSGWLSAVAAEDRPAVAAAWAAAVGHGGHFRSRVGMMWVEVDIAAIRDADGGVVEHVAAFVAVRPIGDHEGEADSGIDPRLSLRFLADHLVQLVGTADASGITEYVNPSFVELTGLSVEQVRVHGLREAFHPDDREEAVDLWRRAFASGRPFEHVLRLRSARDGTYRWFRSRSQPQIEDGRVVRWFVIMSDIDDQRRNEERFEAERRRLYLLLGAAPALISVRRGPELTLEFANEQARRVLHEQVLAGAESLATPSVLRRVYDTGERAVSFELPALLPWRDSGPKERYFNVVHEPMRGYDGDVEGVVTFAFDVTTQVLARQRAEALAEDLRKAVRSRDDFLSIAGHELKTPLAALQLQVQGLQRTLRRGGELDVARFVERLDKAVSHIGRLERLVDELLDVARIAAGRITFTFEEVDLAGLAAEVAERFADELARSGSSLIIQGERHVTGRWDRLRVDQIVTNLISNAVKYGAGKPIEVQVKTSGAWATIAVKDHGVGIAAEDQPRLFGRFERAFSGRSAGGLGLGLWITRRFVEALGGRVTFTSELGRGSVFLVELPRAPGAT